MISDLPQSLSPGAARQRHMLAMSVAAPVSGADWGFTDVTGQAGVGYEYGLGTDTGGDQLAIIRGVAAGDYDYDGDLDIFIANRNAPAAHAAAARMRETRRPG